MDTIYRKIGKVIIQWSSIEFGMVIQIKTIQGIYKKYGGNDLNKISKDFYGKISSEDILRNFKKATTDNQIFQSKSEIFNDLKVMLNIRNNLAHGWFRGSNGKISGIINKDNSSKTLKVDDQFDSFMKRFKNVRKYF